MKINKGDHWLKRVDRQGKHLQNILYYLPHKPLQPPETFLQPLCSLCLHQDGISLPTLKYFKNHHKQIFKYLFFYKIFI